METEGVWKLIDGNMEAAERSSKAETKAVRANQSLSCNYECTKKAPVVELLVILHYKY